jgi:peptidoglycan/xylan/chitin deacetylase (PgdA/CDA1 family)
VLSTVQALQLVPLGWDIDPRDWSRPGTGLVTSRLLAARPGDILLCHDGGGNRAQTIESLRTVLPTLKGRGLQFVTL